MVFEDLTSFIEDWFKYDSELIIRYDLKKKSVI